MVAEATKRAPEREKSVSGKKMADMSARLDYTWKSRTEYPSCCVARIIGVDSRHAQECRLATGMCGGDSGRINDESTTQVWQLGTKTVCDSISSPLGSWTAGQLSSW